MKDLMMTLPSLPDGAATYAPVLLLDRAEPFRPTGVGVTEFTQSGRSPSSKFTVTPQGVRCLEYAVFWDHDIGHTYDLEHIWVHLSAAGTVTALEASFHGQRHTIDIALRGQQPMIWVEAGKHAHFKNRAHRDQMAEVTRQMTGAGAGKEGLHLGNPFAADFGAVSAQDHRVVRLHLQRLAFCPALGRAMAHNLADAPLMAWDDLAQWIPKRVQSILADLRAHTPHFPAIFFDCGDTLADEGTEIKRDDGSDVVLEAKLIEGASQVLHDLRAQGYRLALVADGPRETFENILKPHGLWDLFEAHVISGDVGCKKPESKMFATAMQLMGIAPEQACHVPMIGNNLDRDILGANAAGHPSVFFDWSDRRRRVAHGPEDQPRLRFSKMADLVPLLQFFETTLEQDVSA